MNKKIALILGFVLVVGLGVWGWWSRSGVSEALKQDPSLLAEHEKLKNADATTPPGTLSIALHRLSGKRTPEGLKWAYHFADHSHSSVRQAAATSLGRYPFDPAMAQRFRKWFRDSEPSVRTSAIESVGQQRDEKRREFLLEELKDSSWTPRDQVSFRFSLLRLTADPKISSEISREMLKLVSSSELPNEESIAMHQTLLRIQSREDEIQAYLLRLWQNDLEKLPPNLVSPLYRQLARSKKEDLIRLLGRDSTSTRVEIQMAVLGAMAELCPPDRWKILETMEKKAPKDSRPLEAALRAARNRLGGSRANDRCLNRKQAEKTETSPGKPRE